MAQLFKRRFWKTSKWLIGLFILLFIFRMIYGYTANDPERGGYYGGDFFRSLDNVRKNYASENFSKQGNVQAQANFASNQKYEKTASIKTNTSEFEKDDNLIKTTTKSFNAIIQYEQNLGQKGSRQLHLLIGVNPALFDSFYLQIQKIGTIKAMEITKVDKTTEYKQLNAKKASIEKALQSLNELKSKGGQLSDFVSLNDKILEVEEKLQELGVELGNFDAENEFCTVKLSLYEGVAEKSISFIHRLKVALEWTIKYYAVMIVAILACLLSIFILLIIVDKLKLMKAVSSTINQ